MPKLSVIIPTLNEAANLPNLLQALQAQTRPPDEVIVADAGSKDGTVELARQYGALVVPGGMPGPGRNAGARAAQGDIFLFFDADVQPGPDFLERAVDEFDRRGYAVATCLTQPLGSELGDKILMDASNKIVMEATNLYMQIIQPVSPRAPGFCIFARRGIHAAIGGFDESLKMSEDHDYVRRATQYGEFGILTRTRIPVSMRRLKKEGLAKLAVKYLWCEMYALAGKPIRSMPFEYEFGAFQSEAAARGHTILNVGELRARLDRFGDPLEHLSRRGQEQLQRLVNLPIAARENFRLLLDPPDLDALDDYLQRRLSLLRENMRLDEKLARLKALPNESIRLLEGDWSGFLSVDEVPPEQDHSDD